MTGIFGTALGLVPALVADERRCHRDSGRALRDAVFDLDTRLENRIDGRTGK